MSDRIRKVWCYWSPLTRAWHHSEYGRTSDKQELVVMLPAADYDALVLRADGVGDTAQIAYDSLKIEHDALTQALADAKADVKNPASLRLLVSELESRCRKADESIQQCRTYLRGCMNHAFDETPIVEVAKDVTEEFHRNRYQIQCMAKERDTIAKERDVANLLLKRLMCVVVPDNVAPNDMKEFIRDSAATVLKDLYDYLKTDVDLRKAEHDAR